MVIKLLTLTFYVLVVLTSKHVYAQDKLNIVVGLVKPPYIIEGPMKGFEIELIDHILEQMNSSANYIFVSYGRSARMLKETDVDAILTINESLVNNEGTLSDIYITYQNVAISLESNHLEINDIDDLSKYSLATFQNAHKVLGEAFAKSAEQSPLYAQVANQKLQLEMLFKGRTEVLIMDINIFNYYLKNYAAHPLKKQVKIHRIFPKSPYKVAFKEEKIATRFNTILTSVLTSDFYKELLAKYQLQDQQH